MSETNIPVMPLTGRCHAWHRLALLPPLQSLEVHMHKFSSHYFNQSYTTWYKQLHRRIFVFCVRSSETLITQASQPAFVNIPLLPPTSNSTFHILAEHRVQPGWCLLAEVQTLKEYCQTGHYVFTTMLSQLF